jgi:Cell surface heme-binding protein Shp.
MKKVFSVLIGVMLFAFSYNTVYAIEDGAYTVNRTSSYNNPDTGLTARGETSNATGNNMVANILAADVLVEISEGRTFVTIGLGMESAIRNVAMQIQEHAGGPFLIVPHTITGTSALNDDTCVHYRFEVVSPELIIAPRFIVDGMGMELEFYVTLDMNSRTQGSSIFLSEMVQAPANDEEELPEEEIEEQEEEPTEQELAMEERLERRMLFMDPEADPLIGTSGLSTHVFIRSEMVEEPEATSSNLWLYITAGVVGVGVLAGGYLIYRKKKRGDVS